MNREAHGPEAGSARGAGGDRGGADGSDEVAGRVGVRRDDGDRGVVDESGGGGVAVDGGDGVVVGIEDVDRVAEIALDLLESEPDSVLEGDVATAAANEAEARHHRGEEEAEDDDHDGHDHEDLDEGEAETSAGVTPEAAGAGER